MRMLWKSALSLLICTASGACGSPSGADLLEPSNVQAEEQEVSYDEVEEAKSFLSGITDRRRLVIEDPEAWSQFWAELQSMVVPKPDPPAVDFSTHVVVAATMGQRATGGYSIRIDRVSRLGATTEVVVVETAPGVACLTTQALTAPATAITVARPVGDVEFVERAETDECT